VNWIEIKEIHGAGLFSPLHPKKLLVFSNPFSREINVQLSTVSKLVKTTLYDISGKHQIQNTQSGANRITVASSDLPAGVYILQTCTDQGVFTNKIVLR
jgi:hypothetical protein